MESRFNTLIRDWIESCQNSDEPIVEGKISCKDKSKRVMFQFNARWGQRHLGRVVKTMELTEMIIPCMEENKALGLLVFRAWLYAWEKIAYQNKRMVFIGNVNNEEFRNVLLIMAYQQAHGYMNCFYK